MGGSASFQRSWYRDLFEDCGEFAEQVRAPPARGSEAAAGAPSGPSPCPLVVWEVPTRPNGWPCCRPLTPVPPRALALPMCSSVGSCRRFLWSGRRSWLWAFSSWRAFPTPTPTPLHPTLPARTLRCPPCDPAHRGCALTARLPCGSFLQPHRRTSLGTLQGRRRSCTTARRVVRAASYNARGVA